MRNFENITIEQAERNGWTILEPLCCVVVGKAVYEEVGTAGLKIMKSTKRFSVPGGWIYNTTTEIHKGDQISCAEALCFVPSCSHH